MTITGTGGLSTPRTPNRVPTTPVRGARRTRSVPTAAGRPTTTRRARSRPPTGSASAPRLPRDPGTMSNGGEGGSGGKGGTGPTPVTVVAAVANAIGTLGWVAFVGGADLWVNFSPA